MLGKLSTFAQHLLAWYDENRRDLPWRLPRNSCATSRLNPYHVLVSEAMLQQTQVATVVPYYQRFLDRFPSIAELACADEHDVLRLWQGLGYYSRARNLHAAAKRIANDLGGKFPETVESLRELPGVGRYTAGAVASIAFDRRAPILDGNVVRVLCRIDKINGDPREKETQRALWARAEEILPGKRPGDFNSALMELGATICTPRNPRCLFCPVREHCEAFAAGVQEQIPPPKKRAVSPLEHRRVFCIRRGDRYLLERRPTDGRWGGMWQFITVVADEKQSPAHQLKLAVEFKCSAPREIGKVAHMLTHRRYRFDVFACESKTAMKRSDSSRAWCRLSDLAKFALPRPHLRIAEMLAEQRSAHGIERFRSE
jgi:A/G-specific adenine glycosylase